MTIRKRTLTHTHTFAKSKRVEQETESERLPLDVHRIVNHTIVCRYFERLHCMKSRAYIQEFILIIISVFLAVFSQIKYTHPTQRSSTTKIDFQSHFELIQCFCNSCCLCFLRHLFIYRLPRMIEIFIVFTWFFWSEISNCTCVVMKKRM